MRHSLFRTELLCVQRSSLLFQSAAKFSFAYENKGTTLYQNKLEHSLHQLILEITSVLFELLQRINHKVINSFLIHMK